MSGLGRRRSSTRSAVRMVQYESTPDPSGSERELHCGYLDYQREAMLH